MTNVRLGLQKPSISPSLRLPSRLERVLMPDLAECGIRVLLRVGAKEFGISLILTGKPRAASHVAHHGRWPDHLMNFMAVCKVRREMMTQMKTCFGHIQLPWVAYAAFFPDGFQRLLSQTCFFAAGRIT